MSGIRKAGDIVTDLFREKFGNEFMETARSTAGLFSSWPGIVAEVWPRPFDGELKAALAEDMPAAAVHSRIRELERGVLLVEADHPGWVQILQTKQAELLAAFQRRYAELNIRAIAFRLSRDTIAPPPGAEEKAPGQGTGDHPLKSEGQEPRASGNTARREDEELYTVLKGLEESLKKRNKL